MEQRIRFTTRDWLWLCIVLALAFGWGGHYRYSLWLEENLVKDRPADVTVEEMRTALNDERETAAKLRLENARLDFAIRNVLTPEQQEVVEKAKQQMPKLRGEDEY
jgi:hypothetical protein